MRIGILLIMLTVVSAAYALSDEALLAGKQLDDAQVCFSRMIERGLPLDRANSSLQEALQLYAAQVSLEETGERANYRLVEKFSAEVCQIKEVGLKADDELQVFIDTFRSAEDTSNLSSIYEYYNRTVISFEEERFEETLDLIEGGYVKISEAQASQTALRLFYETTSRTLKTFFQKNWKKMVITAAVILVLLIIFWTTLKRIRINMKIRTLEIRKDTLNHLIKQLQGDYFKKKKLPEMAYKVKLRSFKDMILDIDRQIPLMKEKIAKLKKKNKR